MAERVCCSAQVDPFELKLVQLQELISKHADEVRLIRDNALRTAAGEKSEGSASGKNVLLVGRRAHAGHSAVGRSAGVATTLDSLI